VSVTSDALTRDGRTPVADPAAGDPAANGRTPGAHAGDDSTGPRWRRILASPDFRAVLVYLLLAGWMTDRFWRYMGHYAVKDNGTDHIQFQYFLVWSARVVTHLEYPFFFTQLNYPDGVNLMANTPAFGLTIPLVPFTLLFGPQFSFAMMTVIALAGTAFAWYWFLSRHVVSSRLAAAVGGLLCGFGPGMQAQALAHPNIAAQFTVPLILAVLIRLGTPGPVLRKGIVLGLLIVYQAFINEEILFFVALSCGIFFGVWALMHRAEAKEAIRPFAKGLGIAAGLALVLLAYPLYHQFAGPGAYHGMWDGAQRFGNDIKSFPLFSSTAVAGAPGNTKFSEGAAEQNAYFGWPLLVLMVVVVASLWKHKWVRAVCATGGVALLLSLGPYIVYGHHLTKIPGPYLIFFHLPLFDSVIATRWSLVALPLMGLLLAFWLDRVLAAIRVMPRERSLQMQAMVWGLVAVALVPLAPRRIHILGAEPLPKFFTSGDWRAFVPADRTVVPAPLASNAESEESMRWAAAQDLDFKMPGGYFLGPDPRSDTGRSMFGSPPRPTSKMWIKVWKTHKLPKVTAQDKANAVADLKFWRAAIVVVPGGQGSDPKEELFYKLNTQLLGFSPTWRDGVWVWDVRQLAS
jgi:hypothetical protein